MEITCQNVKELMLELITGALPVQKAHELQHHVDQCSACREYLRALRADDKLLGEFAEAMQPTVDRLENKVIDALEYKPSRKPVMSISIWRSIMKNKITKLATTAAIIIAIFIGINYFNIPIDGASITYAEIRDAVNKMPVMHKVLQTYSNGRNSRTESWYSFESKTLLAKYAPEGKCKKISSLNYDTMENIVYDVNSDIIRISYRVDVNPHAFPPSPWLIVENYIDDFKYQNAVIKHERSQYEGSQVDIYSVSIPRNFRDDKVEAEFIVDSDRYLPILYKRKYWTPKGQLRFDQVINFNFPDSSPENIYEFGVPTSAKVVKDLESKKRLEKKHQLLQEKLVYEEQFKKFYRLKREEVLKHIPLSLAEVRIQIDEIKNTIRILEREGSPIMPSLSPDEIKRMNKESHYTMFSWNGERAKDGATFTDGVSLETAFERIIGLSKFEYNSIPDTLLSIRIPGDWVVREGASKEHLLKAFEQVVQEYTNQPIRFEKQQVELDAIVARGKFRFKPLTGTYNCRWIHVYSDKLDPDERGGGGTYSLDRFLTQRLAETQLKQHVVNLTDSSDDVRAKWGCHMSSYLGKIAPGPERDAKLDQLLDNLAKQTSLTFTKELRKVGVWCIVQDD